MVRGGVGKEREKKMRKICMVMLAVVCLACLSGCPGTAKSIIGSWIWIEAQTPGDSAAGTNALNANRVRKSLVFTKDDGFTYTEERFLSDRLGDNADAQYSWQVVYKVEGTYQTGAFKRECDECAMLGLDTQLLVNVARYSELKQEGDWVGGVLMYTYSLETHEADSATNPLVVRALLGMTPFDELLVDWAEGNEWDKDLGFEDFNCSMLAPETYTRVE